MDITIHSNARTWAEINLDALKNNLDYIKNTAKAPIMCIIKANAYGHDAVICGKFLQDNGAAAFAVACLEEAIELRVHGITIPMLILGYTDADYADVIYENNLMQTVVSMDHAKALNAAAKKAGVRVDVHVKVDTGMGRAGFLAQDSAQITETIDDIALICNMEHLNVIGLYTHFAVADVREQRDYTARQRENFLAVKHGLIKKGYQIQCCHASNSSAILEHPDCAFDMVRAGITLYGMYPDRSIIPDNDPLKPVMTFKSRISQIKELKVGMTVSYGRTFTAPKPMKVAVINAGYADGYPWRLNNAYIMVNGVRCPQIGRICMDMIMADVSAVDARCGDEVILFGSGGMSVQEVANSVGTICYEITCLVTPRAKRVAVDNSGVPVLPTV